MNVQLFVGWLVVACLMLNRKTVSLFSWPKIPNIFRPATSVVPLRKGKRILARRLR